MLSFLSEFIYLFFFFELFFQWIGWDGVKTTKHERWCWWFRRQRISRRWNCDRNTDCDDRSLVLLLASLFVLAIVLQDDLNMIRVVECRSSNNNIRPKLNNVAIVPRRSGNSFASSLLRRGRSSTSTSLSDTFPTESKLL